MSKRATASVSAALCTASILGCTGVPVASAAPKAITTHQEVTTQNASIASTPARSILPVDSAALAVVDRIFTEDIGFDSTRGWFLKSGAEAHDDVTIDDLTSIVSELNQAEESRPSIAAATAPVGWNTKTGIETPTYSVGSSDYLHCVLNYTGFGGLYAAIWGGGSAASILAGSGGTRFLLSSIIKFVGVSALKGGVAGTLAALGAAATWCATPWA